MFAIPEVKSADQLLDEAIKRGVKRVRELRQQLRAERGTKAKALERERLGAIQQQLKKSLTALSARFPSIDQQDEFTTRLIDELIGVDRLRKALASTWWAAEQVTALTATFKKRIGATRTKEELLTLKRAALGRIASVLKQIDTQLSFLDDARKLLRDFPALKKDTFTVAIAGFPNVGKSTLLRKLTQSTPTVAAYPFTTKKLNVGSFMHRHNRIQLIDTPGTLARDKMNLIERKADLALRYAAHIIVYVYDPTEPYALEEQERLARRVKRLGKDVLLYMSKADLIDAQTRRRFEQKGCCTDAHELKKQITDAFEEWL